jgi:hypothetical protein
MVIHTQTDEESFGSFQSKLFNRDVELLVNGPIDIDYVSRCINHLESLPDKVLEEVLERTIQYRNACRSALGKSLLETTNSSQIMKSLTPNMFIVDDEQEQPIINIELGCDWDAEHGLQWGTKRGHFVKA